ncbi:hypothetical protein HYDPIDRAFT_92368 [Hydnomerulius pinastri MD-312]|uniref:RTA1-like protein n=1 Tax=Hydnomerulius pinastri MD-312 TaxID=994086 RepID=A0A0C9VDR9_9AGAM|nr:hypothetical protein HYDPIDRAFT_92368 [Hydnomerulius pinastri MD-312]
MIFSAHATSAAIELLVECPADPFYQPQLDPCNPMGYIASNTWTGITVGAVLIVATIQLVLVLRQGARWMLLMVAGLYTYVVGFGFRFALHSTPDSLGIYITQYLLIVLSPCASIAANYVLLGRLAGSLRCEEHILFPVQRLTLTFVASDVTTFLIQAVGGGLMAEDNVSIASAASHVFLAGLVLQLASFAVFTFIFALFLWRVCKREPQVWARDRMHYKTHRTMLGRAMRWMNDWRLLAGALGISCVGILIRSSYRVAEISHVFHGGIFSSELYFYAFDTLPLFMAAAVYVPCFPGRFLENRAGRRLF